jgi:CxxC motif-containing protein (DUF1111 family)
LIRVFRHSGSRRRLGAAALATLAGIAASVFAAAVSDGPLGERTGGEGTVYAEGRNAFSFPLATLSDEERTRFVIGNSFFRRNWVEAPASTRARDGLGPHFIARSCGGCHVQDGRGAPPPPDSGEQPVGLLLRLSVPGLGPHGGVLPEPTYGDQFNTLAVQRVNPEGRVTISYRELRGAFADGTTYVLRQPMYGFEDLGYGPMAFDVMVSPRIAPHLAGVGLLDAVPEAAILANQVQQAALAGPIKGVANRVWDAFGRDVRIGRFGWKANVATLAHQTAAAFVGDMGVTSSAFPEESCTPVQADCLAAPRGSADGGGPEIDDETFAQVVFYESTLAPAARRNASDPVVLEGQTLFVQAQCSTCHMPSYVTGAGPFPGMTSPKVSVQRIWPYTDLLLHDMGEALADHRPEFRANGRQWKTPPLWGIGLIRDVNGHQRLLHDGRADGILEAILWHAGEAEEAKRRVLQLSRDQRQALVKFVESL